MSKDSVIAEEYVASDADLVLARVREVLRDPDREGGREMTACTLTSHTAAGVRRIEAHTPTGLVATAVDGCDGKGWVVLVEPIVVGSELDARALLAMLCGAVTELRRGRAVVA